MWPQRNVYWGIHQESDWYFDDKLYEPPDVRTRVWNRTGSVSILCYGKPCLQVSSWWSLMESLHVLHQSCQIIAGYREWLDAFKHFYRLLNGQIGLGPMWAQWLVQITSCLWLPWLRSWRARRSAQATCQGSFPLRPGRVTSPSPGTFSAPVPGNTSLSLVNTCLSLVNPVMASLSLVNTCQVQWSYRVWIILLKPSMHWKEVNNDSNISIIWISFRCGGEMVLENPLNSQSDFQCLQCFHKLTSEKVLEIFNQCESLVKSCHNVSCNLKLLGISSFL